MTTTTLAQPVQSPAETGPNNTKTMTAQATSVQNGVEHSEANGIGGIQSDRLAQLFANSGILKIWKTATEHLEKEVCLPMSGVIYAAYTY